MWCWVVVIAGLCALLQWCSTYPCPWTTSSFASFRRLLRAPVCTNQHLVVPPGMFERDAYHDVEYVCVVCRLTDYCDVLVVMRSILPAVRGGAEDAACEPDVLAGDFDFMPLQYHHHLKILHTDSRHSRQVQPSTEQ